MEVIKDSEHNVTSMINNIIGFTFLGQVAQDLP